MDPRWLHRHDGWELSAARHGWSDGRGPDFLAPVDGADHGEQVAQLAAAVGVETAAWVRQVHGGVVLKATQSGYAGEADALWTDRRDLGVVARSADCPLVLVAGRRADDSALAGIAHASWRSTVAGITAGLLDTLREAGLRVETAGAVICPSAGPCCYEVGTEVETAALDALGPGAESFFRPSGDRLRFDLWAANTAQLAAAGVAVERVAISGICTICRGRIYPSHRRQRGNASRFAAVIAPA